MYVLDGEILMHMDGQDHRVSAGGLTVAPRGVPTPMVVSETARLLCLHTPGLCPRATALRSQLRPIRWPGERTTLPG
ncbi:MAG: hypothetical protein M3313_00645 [Actinomycetota bacterium]|nr:hypothetical protein [Actinomycetota bacterium]